MKPRIPKRVREEAALICAIAASTPDMSCGYERIRVALGIPSYGAPGHRWGQTLESAAWRVVCRSPAGSRMSSAELDAEAEALIRTGWSPGDPL